MRTKVVLLVVLPLFLSLPVAVWADPISYQNTGGKITSDGSVLTLATSSVSGGGNLSFSTGSLISGSVATGAVFGAGGTIQIVGNGHNGLPAGLLFSGSFTQSTNWSATWNPTAGPNRHGAWYYTLSAAVKGSLSDGQLVSGNLELFSNDVPSGQPFDSFVNVNQGVLNLSVPEPSSIGLLGTGLVWILGFVRRKPL